MTRVLSKKKASKTIKNFNKFEQRSIHSQYGGIVSNTKKDKSYPLIKPYTSGYSANINNSISTPNLIINVLFDSPLKHLGLNTAPKVQNIIFNKDCLLHEPCFFYPDFDNREINSHSHGLNINISKNNPYDLYLKLLDSLSIPSDIYNVISTKEYFYSKFYYTNLQLLIDSDSKIKTYNTQKGNIKVLNEIFINQIYDQYSYHYYNSRTYYNSRKNISTIEQITKELYSYGVNKYDITKYAKSIPYYTNSIKNIQKIYGNEKSYEGKFTDLSISQESPLISKYIDPEHHIDHMDDKDFKENIISLKEFGNIFMSNKKLEKGDNLYIPSSVDMSRRAVRDNTNVDVNIKRKIEDANVIVIPSDLLSNHFTLKDIISCKTHTPLLKEEQDLLNQYVNDLKKILEYFKNYKGKYKDIIKHHFDQYSLDEILCLYLPLTLLDKIDKSIHEINPDLVSYLMDTQADPLYNKEFSNFIEEFYLKIKFNTPASELLNSVDNRFNFESDHKVVYSFLIMNIPLKEKINLIENYFHDILLDAEEIYDNKIELEKEASIENLDQYYSAFSKIHAKDDIEKNQSIEMSLYSDLHRASYNKTIPGTKVSILDNQIENNNRPVSTIEINPLISKNKNNKEGFLKGVLEMYSPFIHMFNRMYSIKAFSTEKSNDWVYNKMNDTEILKHVHMLASGRQYSTLEITGDHEVTINKKYKLNIKNNEVESDSSVNITPDVVRYITEYDFVRAFTNYIKMEQNHDRYVDDVLIDLFHQVDELLYKDYLQDEIRIKRLLFIQLYQYFYHVKEQSVKGFTVKNYYLDKGLISSYDSLCNIEYEEYETSTTFHFIQNALRGARAYKHSLCSKGISDENVISSDIKSKILLTLNKHNIYADKDLIDSYMKPYFDTNFNYVSSVFDQVLFYQHMWDIDQSEIDKISLTENYQFLFNNKSTSYTKSYKYPIDKLKYKVVLSESEYYYKRLKYVTLDKLRKGIKYEDYYSIHYKNVTEYPILLSNIKGSKFGYNNEFQHSIKQYEKKKQDVHDFIDEINKRIENNTLKDTKIITDYNLFNEVSQEMTLEEYINIKNLIETGSEDMLPIAMEKLSRKKLNQSLSLHHAIIEYHFNKNKYSRIKFLNIMEEYNKVEINTYLKFYKEIMYHNGNLIYNGYDPFFSLPYVFLNSNVEHMINILNAMCLLEYIIDCDHRVLDDVISSYLENPDRIIVKDDFRLSSTRILPGAMLLNKARNFLQVLSHSIIKNNKNINVYSSISHFLSSNQTNIEREGYKNIIKEYFLKHSTLKSHVNSISNRPLSEDIVPSFDQMMNSMPAIYSTNTGLPIYKKGIDCNYRHIENIYITKENKNKIAINSNILFEEYDSFMVHFANKIFENEQIINNKKNNKNENIYITLDYHPRFLPKIDYSDEINKEFVDNMILEYIAINIINNITIKEVISGPIVIDFTDSQLNDIIIDIINSDTNESEQTDEEITDLSNKSIRELYNIIENKNDPSSQSNDVIDIDDKRMLSICFMLMTNKRLKSISVDLLSDKAFEKGKSFEYKLEIYD